MTDEELIEAWRAIINGPEKSWVLFENGTCVILTDPQGDLAAQATALLAEWGPVRIGSSFADFAVIELEDGRGWAVTCHHNDILTLVTPDEIKEGASDVAIGLLGRAKRNRDAEELRVLHVEDRRKAAE